MKGHIEQMRIDELILLPFQTYGQKHSGVTFAFTRMSPSFKHYFTTVSSQTFLHRRYRNSPIDSNQLCSDKSTSNFAGLKRLKRTSHPNSDQEEY